jgi:hypothetical protein
MDELREHPKFKYSLKNDVIKFQDWVEEYIKGPVSSLTKADDHLLVEFINIFNSYEETVFIKDEFQTRINLLLAKCHSVMYDLAQLDSIHSHYVIELSGKVTNLISKGYFKPYVDYIDPEGHSFGDIVQIMNRDGDTIIVGES